MSLTVKVKDGAGKKHELTLLAANDREHAVEQTTAHLRAYGFKEPFTVESVTTLEEESA